MLLGYIVKVNPAAVHAGHNALRTQNKTVFPGIKSIQCLFDIRNREFLCRLYAPRGEYLIGVMMVMIVVAAAVAILVVLMIVVVVTAAVAILVVVMLVVVVAAAVAILVVVMLLVVVTAAVTVLVVVMLVVVVAAAVAVLVVVGFLF